MTPPISIDGTDITGATIDGTDVQEITVDGDVVFTSQLDLPNNAVHHYDISQLTGFSDGDPVTTIPDLVGSADLSGTGTYRSSAINGNPAIELDGVDDVFIASTPPISTAKTLYLVFEWQSSSDQVLVSFEAATGPQSTHNITIINNANEIFAGSALVGSSDLTIQQITAVFDGANSILREQGTQTASGDSGNRITNNDLFVGARQGPTQFFSNAYFGELVVTDTDNVDVSYESNLLSKWGI